MADSLGGTNHSLRHHSTHINGSASLALPSNPNPAALLRHRVYRQQQADPKPFFAHPQFATPQLVNHANPNLSNLSNVNLAHHAAARRAHQIQQAQAQARAVHAAGSRPAKSTIVSMKGVGPCVQQLQKFCNEQRRGHVKNSLEGFWKPFVSTFFAPNATILLDVMTPSPNTGTTTGTGNPNISTGPNGTGSANIGQNRSITIPVEAMPRILKSKYDAGVTDEKLLLEMPIEFVLENGVNVVDCPQTTVLTSFPQSKVCTDGHLRVSFTGDKKITKWEFTTRSNEELFTRNVLGRNQIPDPVCTPYGVPFSALMLYAIAESINDMGPTIVSKMALLANSTNNNNNNNNNSNATGNGNGNSNGNNNNTPDPAAITAAVATAAGDNSIRSKDTLQQKEASNIITQLNETASSMMPEKSKGSGGVPSSRLGAGTSAITPDFGIPMNGRGPSSTANGFDLDTATVAAANSSGGVGLEASTSNAQLQLAQMQQQQQQQLAMNLQNRMIPSSAAVPADMISAGMNMNNVTAGMNINMSSRANGASADALLGNQWPSFPNPAAAVGMFGTGNGDGAGAGDANGTSVAPAGLSEFTPGDFGVSGNNNNSNNNDGLDLEGNAFQLEMYSTLNGTGTNANNSNNNINNTTENGNANGIANGSNNGGGVAGVAVSAAVSAVQKRTSQSQVNSTGNSKANKRRRGAQPSAVL